MDPELPTPEPNKLDPRDPEITKQFIAIHRGVMAEVRRIQARQRRRQFLQILPGVIVGTAVCALIGLGIGWMVIQILKP